MQQHNDWRIFRASRDSVKSHAAILEEHGLQRSVHNRKVYNYREIRR